MAESPSGAGSLKEGLLFFDLVNSARYTHSSMVPRSERFWSGDAIVSSSEMSSRVNFFAQKLLEAYLTGKRNLRKGKQVYSACIDEAAAYLSVKG